MAPSAPPRMTPLLTVTTFALVTIIVVRQLEAATGLHSLRGHGRDGVGGWLRPWHGGGYGGCAVKPRLCFGKQPS